MIAPINVKIKDPTVNIVGWQIESEKWLNLNREIGGNPWFYPLTVKGAYVLGIIHAICQSVSHLLSHVNVKNITYIPAFGIFSSGVELLGRCINGNPDLRGTVKDLRNGYKWLASSEINNISDNFQLIETQIKNYSITQLASLRHFAAHGQATASDVDFIDYEILGMMSSLLADGLDRYWEELKTNEKRCNALAKSNILPLRGWPVKKSWLLFEADKFGKYHSVKSIFTRFQWTI